MEEVLNKMIEMESWNGIEVWAFHEVYKQNLQDSASHDISALLVTFISSMPGFFILRRLAY
jgi:hypothetical protein